MNNYFRKTSLYGRWCAYKNTITLSQKLVSWLLNRNTIMITRLAEITVELDELEEKEKGLT